MKKPSVSDSSSRPVASSVGFRSQRLRWLIALAIGLGALTVGVYVYRGQSPGLPSIPSVNLEGADDEVTALVETSRQQVEADPRSAKAWAHLAMVLHANGFDAAADECYAATEQFDPKNWHWPYLRGYLRIGGPGGPATAQPFFESAAEHSQPDSLGRIRLADALLELGELEQAEQHYQRVLQANPREPLAMLGMGKVFVLRQEYQEAIRFLAPLDHNPLVQQRATTMLAQVYKRLDDLAAAEREQQRLASLPTDAMHVDDPILEVIALQIDVGRLIKRAQALWNQKQTAEMLKVMRQAVAKYPESDVAWSSLATALAATGDSAKAEPAMRRSIELAPKTVAYRLSLGKLLLAQKRYAEAEASLQMAVTLQPHDAEANLLLGECRLKQGKRAAAKELFEAALRAAPGDAAIRRRVAELEEELETLRARAYRL